jgi:preprotein translocase subunit YajC
MSKVWVTAIVLLVLTLMFYFPVSRALSEYLDGNPEDPAAADVYALIAAAVTALAFGYYLWDRNRKKAKG